MLKETDLAAGALGLRLPIVRAYGPEDFPRAFAEIKRRQADALTVLSSPVFAGQRRRIAELAIKNRLPTVFAFRSYVDAGGLMSYGPDMADLFRRPGAPGMGPEISVDAAHLHAPAPHDVVIRTQQEMDFVAVATELRAVVTAQRATAHHTDSHGVFGHWGVGVFVGPPASSPQYPITPLPRSSGNKKGHPEISERPWEIEIVYLAPRIASLAALATRNFTTRLAGI